MTKFLNISTDGTLTGNSDSTVVSEKAIKTYADTKQVKLVSGTNIKTVNGNSLLGSGDITISSGVAWGNITGTLSDQTDLQNALNAKANSADLATVATTGSYNDLLNKPTIPTVNNATLTIQKNGTTVQTFTANQSTNATANISVPTKTSDITNDSGFITGITSSDVTTALGYTPYNSSNPNGYTSNVGTVTSVNNTSPDGSGNVSLTIPTVNDATITITQGGVTKGSFTLNQASGDTIALDAGGGGGSGYTPNIFDWKWADHELDDMSWLRADTGSWQDGTVYSDAYNHLVNDISGKTLQTETGGGATVSFYLADDGHKICPASEESNVTAIYNATGVAWYYIIDTANTRFKLPRTKYGVTGLRDTVGNYVAPGLPNITGSITRVVTTDGNTTTGAFSLSGSAGTIPGYNSGTPQRRIADFDASRSSAIYGNDTTVQAPATQMYLYFYVGQFSQTATEQTAGLNAELFNGKADINLNNTPMATADYVVEWQEPTSANNYTWYRKYKSGWVEQGQARYSLTRNTTTAVTLPIEMADTSYTGQISGANITFATASTLAITPKSTTQVNLWNYNSSAGMSVNWQVSGMAA